MTSHEAYLFGYIYGLIDRQLPASEEDKSGKRFSRSCQHPLEGMADIVPRARRAGILTQELDRKIAGLSAGISEEAATDVSAMPIPLPLQGSWQIGYYNAMSELNAKSREAAEIMHIRARLGWNQEKLAEALDTTQATVSRWEKGTQVPTAKTMEKIRALVEEQPL